LFLTDGVTASARYAPSGPVSAAEATIAVAYDAGTHSYKITSGSRSQTFLPADKDHAASGAAQLNIYARTAGNVTDSLTLTNAGSAGAFTYRYVGGGYWQRTEQRSDGVLGTFDAFTYGLRTPDSVRPRLGYASYAIDLLGLQAAPDSLASVSGTGRMNVDFVGGDIAFSGNGRAVAVRGVFQGDFSFRGSARLTSGTTGFAGTMQTNFFDGSGTITGGFFGPGAEEVGATFKVAAPGVGGYTVGTLTGRQDAGTGPTLATLATPTNFSLGGERVSWFVNEPQGDMPEQFGPAGPEQSLPIASMYVDPLAKSYAVYTGGDAATVFTPGTAVAAETTGAVRTYRQIADGFTKTLRLYQPSGSDGTLVLSYTGFAEYESVYRTDKLYDRDRRLAFYGLETSPSGRPTSGTGTYAGVLFGNAYGTGANDVYDLRGSARWSIAFDTGAVSGTLSPVITPAGGGTAFDAGTLAMHGAISSYPTRFGGVLTQQQAGGPSFSGSFAGSFFGPIAQETAFAFDGAFARTRPDGSPDPLTVIGVAAGKRQ
jgi:hypothetical protein